MNNNKLTKSIICAGVFAVSLGLGFVGYRLINKGKTTTTDIPVANGGISTSNGSESKNPPKGEGNLRDSANDEHINNSNRQDDISLAQQAQTQDTQEPKVSISATKPKQNGDSYSFVVTATNLSQNESFSFELYNKSVKIQSSTDGVFSNVPGVAGGKYIVWLVGSKSGRLTSTTVRGFDPPKEENDNKVIPDSIKQESVKSEKPKRMLITKEEFQRRLLNPNDLTLKRAKKASDRQSLLSNTFNLVVIDMKTDEAKTPSDLEGVREKILFEAWKSATVVDISYDETTGQVTKAVVKPLY